MHLNEKYLRADTAMLFLEIHPQDMQESITYFLLQVSVTAQVWNQRQPKSHFAVQMCSKFSQLRNMKREILGGETSL